MVQPNEAPEGPRAPAFYRRRRRRGNELGQVLLRKGRITPEQLRQALKIQADEGGHIGAILRRLGACDARAVVDALIEQVRLGRDKERARPAARRARENPALLGLQVHCQPRLTAFITFIADVLSLGASGSLLWVLTAGGALDPSQRLGIVAVVPMCLLVLAALQFYATTPPSPPEELRRVVGSVTLVYAGSWGFVLARPGYMEEIPHHAWLVAWAVSVVVVPIFRGIVRSIFARRDFWGEPVVVVGADKIGRAVVTTLQSRPQLGLKPIAILDDDPFRQGTVRMTWGEDDIQLEPTREDSEVRAGLGDVGPPSSSRTATEQFAEVAGVPVVGGLELAPVLAQRLGIRSIVVAMPSVETGALHGMIERYADAYHNVLVIPGHFNLAYFGAPTRYLGGVLGIEVRRQLLLRGPRLAKRILDIVLVTLMVLPLLPLLVTIGVLIRLDSPGPIFYRQRRLGQDGVRFSALKFRTMHGDGEQRLQNLLDSSPLLRAEYQKFHKLTVDPRVTRIGRVLRKYSLDELPQLLNVLLGDMSLVGPRPYLEREIPEMGGKEAIILRVKPGITGIWQVTDRNASTFEERIQLDVEYVRGWSPWLDLYIIARTVPVVLGGTGS